MRTLRRNKQKLMYSQLLGRQEKYEYDENGNKVVDFVDSDGVTHYVVTGETETLYSMPQSMCANISFSGGDVESVEYGIDVASYDATLVYLLNEFPLTETSLVWYQTEPVIVDGVVDKDSADYKVLSVKPSLNYTKVLLGKLTK